MYEVTAGVYVEKSAVWGAAAMGAAKNVGNVAKSFWNKGMKPVINSIRANPTPAAGGAAAPGFGEAVGNAFTSAGKHMGGAVSGIGAGLKGVAPNMAKGLEGIGSAMAHNPNATAGIGLGIAGLGAYNALSNDGQKYYR